MKNQIGSLSVVLMMACFLPNLFSQNENIWLGGKVGQNADWFVASNWSKQRIPNEKDHVVIPANTSFPVVNGTAVVQALYLESGAEIQLSDNAVLVIKHNKGSGKGLYFTGSPAAGDYQFGLNSFCELVIYQGVREIDATTCPMK